MAKITTPHGAAESDGENFGLLKKAQLAERIQLSEKTVTSLVNRKLIPVVRLSQRCIRFNLRHVEAALSKLETQSA